MTDALWQMRQEPFHFRHCFARTVSRLGRTGNFQGRITVVTTQLHRPRFPARADKIRQRYLLATDIGHMHLQQVFRRHALVYIGLHHDTLQAAGIGKIIDAGRTKGAGNGRIDGRKIHTHYARVFAIDIQTQLRCIIQPFHHGVEQDRAGISFGQ
jgi:hypothetical protein